MNRLRLFKTSLKKIYLFIRLHWVLVVACGISELEHVGSSSLTGVPLNWSESLSTVPAWEFPECLILIQSTHSGPSMQLSYCKWQTGCCEDSHTHPLQKEADWISGWLDSKVTTFLCQSLWSLSDKHWAVVIITRGGVFIFRSTCID